MVGEHHGSPRPAAHHARRARAGRAAAEMRVTNGCSSTRAVEPRLRLLAPLHRRPRAAWDRSGPSPSPSGKHVEERIEQRVADFLHEVRRAGVAHERRARVPTDDRARERRRDVRGPRSPPRRGTCARCSCRTSRAAACSGGTARTSSLSGFTPARARHREGARAARVSPSRKCRTPRAYVSSATTPKLAVAKKSCVTLRQRSHNGLIVVCFSRSMNGSGSSTERAPQRAQERRGGEEADRGLQVRHLEGFAERAAELAVHADAHVGVHEARHVRRGDCLTGRPC